MRTASKLVALFLSLFCQAGFSSSTESSLDHEREELMLAAAIASCRAGIVNNATRDYIKRHGITEEDLPTNFYELIAPAIEPFLQICDCTLNELSKTHSLEYFLTNQDEMKLRSQEILKAGKCNVPSDT